LSALRELRQSSLPSSVHTVAYVNRERSVH